LLGGALLASQSFAAEEEPWTDRFLREFDGVKTRLAALEEQQKEILAKEDKILEELDRIRIWTRRK
jgi:hypothetical protein